MNITKPRQSAETVMVAVRANNISVATRLVPALQDLMHRKEGVSLSIHRSSVFKTAVQNVMFRHAQDRIASAGRVRKTLIIMPVIEGVFIVMRSLFPALFVTTSHLEVPIIHIQHAARAEGIHTAVPAMIMWNAVLAMI